MLDQDAEEALQRAVDRAVNHDRRAPLAVLGHVDAAQPRRLNQIQLHRRELPLAAHHVADEEIGLRSVEGSLAFLLYIINAGGVERAAQRIDGRGPGLGIVHKLALAAGQRELVAEISQAIGGEQRAHQLEHAPHLVGDVLRRAEDVAIVLRQRTHASEAAELARLLVAVERGLLRVAQRQLAVGVQAGVVERHVDGAVHRLEVVLRLAVDHRRIHHVAVVFEVAGALEEFGAGQVPRPHLGVAALQLEFADQPLHLVADNRAVRQQQRDARADLFGESEQAELAPQPSVIALLRLLQPLKVRVELLLAGEQRAVDALQLGARLVAAPVSAGDVGEAERANLAGRLHVPAAAEVGKFGMGAEADGVGVGAELLDQFELVGLVGEARARVVEIRLAPDEAVVALHLLAHPTLDLLKIVGRQRPGQFEVVVEAVRDRRANRDLALRKQLEHDLCEHMCGGVPHAAQPLLGVNLIRAGNRRAGRFLINLLLRHRCCLSAIGVVGDTGLEPVTSAMSTRRSSQLS